MGAGEPLRIQIKEKGVGEGKEKEDCNRNDEERPLEGLQMLNRGFILALIYTLFSRRKRPKHLKKTKNLSTLTD